jgi:hypothetical protein
MSSLDSSLSLVGLAPLQIIPIPFAPVSQAKGDAPREDFGFVEALNLTEGEAILDQPSKASEGRMG